MDNTTAVSSLTVLYTHAILRTVYSWLNLSFHLPLCLSVCFLSSVRHVMFRHTTFLQLYTRLAFAFVVSHFLTPPFPCLYPLLISEEVRCLYHWNNDTVTHADDFNLTQHICELVLFVLFLQHGTFYVTGLLLWHDKKSTAILPLHCLLKKEGHEVRERELHSTTLLFVLLLIRLELSCLSFYLSTLFRIIRDECSKWQALTPPCLFSSLSSLFSTIPFVSSSCPPPHHHLPTIFLYH